MSASTSLQGRRVRVNVPSFNGTDSVVASALCRVVVDMTTRFLVLTEAQPVMLYSIEQTRTAIETVGDDALGKQQCVALLRNFLDSKPDVDLVGVFFPYMNYVRDGRLIGEEHQAIVLYNAAEQDAPSVMLANFHHGYQQDREYRIHLTESDYLIGHRLGQHPRVQPGDVDVVKLFSLPDVFRKTWWNWMEEDRVVKLRDGHAVRRQIVTSLIDLAVSNPLVYPEKDESRKVRAIEEIIIEHEGGKKRAREIHIMKAAI